MGLTNEDYNGIYLPAISTGPHKEGGLPTQTCLQAMSSEGERCNSLICSAL